MKIFKFISIFPEIISNYFEHSLYKKAQENKLISLETYNLRDFALDKHKTVDDTPYGGGEGMLFKVDVIGNAISKIKATNDIIIYPSPRGILFNNQLAKKLAQTPNNIIFLCGRYEGIDKRAIELFVDLEISIGEYIINGGEIASIIITDAILRFIPNIIGNQESIHNETFERGNIKYPQWTRPQIYKGHKVPSVLLSGNHQKIHKWRELQSQKETQIYQKLNKINYNNKTIREIIKIYKQIKETTEND